MTATATLATPAPPPGSLPTPGDPGGQDAGTLAVANTALRGGFVLLPRTLLHAPGLSRDAKLLYAVLLSYAWQRGSCFPGYARLQHDLQCGVNQVTKYLRELEGAGLVTRRKRGQGKTTLYTLHDPPAPPTTGPPPSPPPSPAQTHRFGEFWGHQISEARPTDPAAQRRLSGRRVRTTSSSTNLRTAAGAGATNHAGAHHPTGPGAGRRR